MSTVVDFEQIRKRNPGLSPQDLYDRACQIGGSKLRWATVNWTLQAAWLEFFANAPTSDLVH